MVALTRENHEITVEPFLPNILNSSIARNEGNKIIGIEDDLNQIQINSNEFA